MPKARRRSFVTIVSRLAKKCLRAFLLKNNWSLIKTHDLNYLCVEASQYLVEIRDFEASFYELNSLFMASHYPHDVQEPFSNADAEKALKLAQEVQQLLSEHFFHRTPPQISRSEDKRPAAYEDCSVVKGEATVEIQRSLEFVRVLKIIYLFKELY